uniref:Uncharacterized protein n=1 Tax=Piliocolobus tephrosceles TaxID=591936 RepID=A0A8C9HHX2_9PRIM
MKMYILNDCNVELVIFQLSIHYSLFCVSRKIVFTFPFYITICSYGALNCVQLSKNLCLYFD